VARTLVRLSLTLGLLVLALSLPPLAEAGCQYPLSYSKVYYAWISDADPNVLSCTEPTWAAHWGMIGGEMLYCDSSVQSWRDTTTCTGPFNTEISYLYCAPVCD
jgi:hypothetical protein